MDGFLYFKTVKLSECEALSKGSGSAKTEGSRLGCHKKVKRLKFNFGNLSYAVMGHLKVFCEKKIFFR